MGITAIPSVATAETADGRPALNPPTLPQTQPPQADTVQLTEAQQVYQLYNQGQQVSQIADTLNLPVEAVNNYLNLPSASK